MVDNKIRYYILGSEWLYYKIYMGSQTSEHFLFSILKPMAQELLRRNIIDKWFFINYNDPKRHIRVRFHMVDKKDLNHVIHMMFNAVAPYIESKQITDIKTDTYKRELERYGRTTIDQFETLFSYNSNMVIDILEYINDDANKRWLYGLKAIDVFLNAWGLKIEEKAEMFETLEASFSKEMGSTTQVNRQLSEKFRKNRNDIVNILENGDPVLNNILLDYTNKCQPVINDILKNTVQADENNFTMLTAFIHMHCNRLFSSRQRLNEWVICYLFVKYYKSSIARSKN